LKLELKGEDEETCSDEGSDEDGDEEYEMVSEGDDED
jgi:hypothetical protein